ncbi:hypothetical protein L2E82_27909 [Cichorium intybus]|uniref:Uncharacterized protein n=1 Tax=Cichorium intybus TaxID=13427 RepID=A0ACB9CU85_CICIN|nr:hypothetical protein L2E82_27909 [Cichorium intybus]
MQNIYQKRRPPIEELSKRIKELEDAHARLKQQMLKFMISGYHRKTSNLISSRRGTSQHSAHNLTEADYFNIFQSIDRPIHITDSKKLCSNQAWENLYGYTAAEVQGKKYLDLFIEPRDIPIANDVMPRILKGECWTGECPDKTKRGETFVIIGSSKPFRDENGTIIGAITATTGQRSYRQIRLGAPTKIASGNLRPDHNKHSLSCSACSSMVKETKARIDRILSSNLPGYFDSKTGPFCCHWFHSDQEDEYGLRMSAKVKNQQWVTNSVSHDNKALGPWSLFMLDCIPCSMARIGMFPSLPR